MTTSKISSSTDKEYFDSCFSAVTETNKAHLWKMLSSVPKDSTELIKNFLPSKFWRMHNLYKIIDKSGNEVMFKMNKAQLRTYGKLFYHNRLIVLKSRQQGISTLWLISFFDDALFSANLKCGLMAQDIEAAQVLLERIKLLWDNVHPHIKQLLGLKVISDNKSAFELNNGSKLLVRTSFRSMTLQRLHISELGFIAQRYPQKAQETNTGTLQTVGNNPVIIESTAAGQNMFYNKYMAGKEKSDKGSLSSKDFFPLFLPWIFDPDCVESVKENYDEEHIGYFEELEKFYDIKLTEEQKNFWVSVERELGGDVNQEYPGTDEQAFTAAADGSYWRKLFNSYILYRDKLRENLYDHNLPVFVAQDLGRDDYYVLLYFQLFDNEIRIIDEYYNSGEDITHYINKIKTKVTEGWDIERVIFPHDGGVTDLTSFNRTRESIFVEHGFRKTTILPKTEVVAGIELVRKHIPKIFIDKRCNYLIKCFTNYSKDWNNTWQCWDDKPKRTEFSHGADAIRYMSCYVDRYMPNTRVTRGPDLKITI